jgi:hypothetical protein
VHGGDAIEWNAEAVGGAGAEIQTCAVAAVGDGHREGAASVGDAHSGAAGEPGVGGGGFPVAVDVAAVGGAAVVPGVVNRSCYFSSVPS